MNTKGSIACPGVCGAAVTGFFDHQRAASDDFFIYPDYFVFHVGERHGDHAMLDIWPDHKEVTVPDDPEQILQSINDRGITRLLVEDGPSAPPDLTRHTRASAAARILTTLAFGAGGDIAIRGNDVTESYVNDVLDDSTMVPVAVRESIRASRSADLSAETHRRITLDTALSLLAGVHTAGPRRTV